jgi:hypothetical protein
VSFQRLLNSACLSWAGVFLTSHLNLQCSIRSKSVKLSEDMKPESLQQRSKLLFDSLIMKFPRSAKEEGRAISPRKKRRKVLKLGLAPFRESVFDHFKKLDLFKKKSESISSSLPINKACNTSSIWYLFLPLAELARF